MQTKIKSVSPQRTNDVVVEVYEATPVEVALLVAGAREAQAKWWRSGAPARADALARAANALEAVGDEITTLAVREVGKPFAEMVAETARGVAILRYYSQAALDPDGSSLPPAAGAGILLARHRPHGVVGLITPWNFPIAIPLWKAAPALAYGNAVICKPAPAATAVALRLQEILAPFLPQDLFAIAAGDRVAGAALIDAVDAVSFTGSTAVGKLVATAASARGIPVQTEMGGQNPSIVFPDAPIASTARMIARAAMGFSGQKCTATSRIIVVGDSQDFVRALVTEVEGLKRGDPFDSDIVVGPVISEHARQDVVDAAYETKSAGGAILCGGDVFSDEGYFIAPTLVEGLDAKHRLCQVETFGPFAALLRAGDEEEALMIANDVAYGLVASVFTTDLDRALRLGERLESGLVRVNAPTSGVDFYAPFGGIKASSFGNREQGKAARDFYTWTQTLTIAPSA